MEKYFTVLWGAELTRLSALRGARTRNVPRD